MVEHPLGKGKVKDSSSFPGSVSGFVYILKSLRNGRYYIGSTNNLERRIVEHESGKSTYTSESAPWELVFRQEFETLVLARSYEFKLKKLKNRKVLEQIISSGRIFLSVKGTINW